MVAAPANYQQKITMIFNRAVLDPANTSYEFNPPHPEKIWLGLILGGYRDVWVVRFRMNTKKPDGTFTGPFPCMAVFDKKGEITLTLTPPPRQLLELHRRK